MKYLEEARSIWMAEVPARGQATTVQGELLRALEKLRNEARTNGNKNWDDGFTILGRFLRTTLADEAFFAPPGLAKIQEDLDRILDVHHPAEDDVYDDLADRVVEWVLGHPTPIPHQPDPMLHR